jgi:ABC-2 type transport system ATP-binding protein
MGVGFGAGTPLPWSPVLEVRDLTKRYGDVVALDGVGLSVGRGHLVGFLGPNGAGKTTTMRAILGLVGLDAGTVTWDGQPIDRAMRNRIGYMPAERGMYPKMRVREQVVYFAQLAGLGKADATRAADHWLERVGLAERADAEVQDLSSGNQQRVQLALALVNDPELLLLDEPFSGLDPVAVEVLKEVLLEQVAGGAALLFSSHQLDLVEDVSRDVVIIDGGKVVLEGDVDQIRLGSGQREAEIGFATEVDDLPGIPGVQVVGRERGRLRLRVQPDVDPGDLLARASQAGPVTSFSFGPPDLSEVFLATVGRAEGRGDGGDGSEEAS